MTYKETNNLVDFSLCLYAKDYYLAAQALNGSELKSTPYHLMLALSVECFLKSIRTTTIWHESTGVKVAHTKKTHDLSSIFHKLEINHPSDAEWLKNEYSNKYSRSLKGDLELNKNVFSLRRYPYSLKGDIPKVPLATTREELLYGIKYDNDIAVYETILEDIAKFLFDVLTPHIR
ncbi:hypothetical protein [Vibrio parahaemolyticus]|uniref:hypothetical protein n=1 Tax=Vibrio parahaemolyticus TaxID=670 RepID=UPI0004A3E9A7|nr:hypothetical protein [Vibrio parahaemolyticus]EJG1286759.1 hypothetical protein [Vibrio parahaemolyticus]EJG1296109.1 hypothetical protein [Vibrio parahaemolyticus]EJG1329205.1 hypothetical protein [Vibrio parahaemolyticus]KJR17863.1 hypothetical protein UF29_18755 [Vibrio parahaemolyticus]MBE3724894.1 hypothetical protein [Vibrio parahaemolyticus]